MNNMDSIRLNNEMRDSLAEEAKVQSVIFSELVELKKEQFKLEDNMMKEKLGFKAEDSFADIEMKLDAAVKTVQQKIDMLPSPLRKTLGSPGFKRRIMSSSYSVLIQGCYYSMHPGYVEEENTLKRLFPNSFQCTWNAVQDSLYVDDYLKVVRKIKKLEKQVKNLKASVRARLTSFRTTKQLLEEWPESERLLPALQPKGTGLVVTNDALNCSIWGECNESD